MPIYGASARPAVFFIFDCGTVTTLAGIRLQPDELDECRFAAETELHAFLQPAAVPRVRAALAARSSGCIQCGPGLDGPA